MTKSAAIPNDVVNISPEAGPEVLVGRKLRETRLKNGYSLRALADRSGLNINTLSMVENGKTSPSVGTLQQLALALDVPITTFFESTPVSRRVVHTPADQRPQTVFNATRMENLGKDLNANAVQPFVVSLKPGAGSGEQVIVHTGHEFVYCLSGCVTYRVEGAAYFLNPGDSLVFEAHLPHCWENCSETETQFLLIIYPADRQEEPGGRHFSHEYLKKEINMKIALITDDGKSISQHFGRAPYYLVLTIEEGKIVNREMREKMGHNQFSGEHQGEEHHHGEHGDSHGLDGGSHNKHVSMAEAIADCKVVICGGMGMGAYESMRRLNIQPVVTDLSDIEAAAQACLDGKLIDHTEKLH
ncbi:MAG: cupin domain-containing protein [Anaerolineaceae bacterium]|nr:cupin domain-containing protein [Anaerolineaceae bacterium]